MKRKAAFAASCFVCIISFLLIVLVLSGCESANNNMTTQNDVESNMGSDGSLVMLANKPGQSVITYGGGTDKGYYDSFQWPYEMYKESSPWIHISNITYLDYASCSRVYLCNTPGCAHNNENCTSFIKYPNSIILFTNKQNTKLFCLALGALNGEIYSDDDLGRIYEMNLDGSNRKELIRLHSTESFSMDDPIIADDNYLYVCKYKLVDNNEIRKIFTKISISSGATTDLFEMNSASFIVDIIDGETIALVDYSSSENAIYRLLSFPEFDVYFEKTINYRYANIKGNCTYSYAVNNNKGVLVEKDLITNTTRMIEGIPTNALGTISIRDIEGDMIHWTYIENTDSEDVITYYCNMSNGSVIKQRLSYTSLDGSEKSYSIIDKNKDQYLVVCGVKIVNMMLTDENGIVHNYPSPYPILGLITAEDYWNNKDNVSIVADVFY